jgi:DNA-binding IclR family transcriptional regulator
VSVLEKSAQIIDVLGHAEGPVRLGAVADAVAMPKSSAHRLLGELSRLGIVRSEGDGEYTLGYRLVRWGALADDRFELRAVAEPVMRRLSDDVSESVHLHVPEGLARVCVAGVPGPHTLRPVIDVGTTRRLGVGAAGKLLLAYADDRVRGRLVDSTPAPQRSALPTDADLAAMRDQGWARSVGELEPGLSAWAAAVTAPDGDAVAALTVSGATTRLPDSRGPEVVARLSAATAEISALLGS